MSEPIPVVLFAYARPAHLQQALACLRADRVPLIYAFADGAKGTADAAMVAETRARLRSIDWCEVRLTERAENLGLGRNVMAGVGEVAARLYATAVTPTLIAAGTCDGASSCVATLAERTPGTERTRSSMRSTSAAPAESE